MIHSRMEWVVPEWNESFRSGKTYTDKDLWSRLMSISLPYHSEINAVSNTTKIAVSYRKKLTVYDVWKDRDYEECPDESEYTQDEEN